MGTNIFATSSLRQKTPCQLIDPFPQGGWELIQLFLSIQEGPLVELYNSPRAGQIKNEEESKT